MIFHTPVLETNIGKVTPVSASLGALGIPLTDSGRKAAQLRSVAGIAEYANQSGLNDSGAPKTLQSTATVPFNGA